MTARLSFTQYGLRRAIEAARKAGLRVTGIRPDGTLIVADGDKTPESVVEASTDFQTASLSPRSKWEDA